MDLPICSWRNAANTLRGGGIPRRGRFLNYGAEGFNLMPPLLPTGLTDFVERVLPELRRRALFREDYEGHALRKNLGLRRPALRVG